MLKKKLLFKEDKNQISQINQICKIKDEGDNMIKSIESYDDIKRIRGRQLNNKENNVAQKCLLNTFKLSKVKNKGDNLKIVNKCNSKIYKLDKGSNNRFNSNNYRADYFEMDDEDDYQSSDSDCSIRNNRKRELLEDNSELPENLKYPCRIESLDNSQELMENYEVCDEFTLTYGDNLTNEVERILIDIYNNHVSVNLRKKIDIAKYEKHVKYYKLLTA